MGCRRGHVLHDADDRRRPPQRSERIQVGGEVFTLLLQFVAEFWTLFQRASPRVGGADMDEDIFASVIRGMTPQLFAR